MNKKQIWNALIAKKKKHILDALIEIAKAQIAFPFLYMLCLIPLYVIFISLAHSGRDCRFPFARSLLKNTPFRQNKGIRNCLFRINSLHDTRRFISEYYIAPIPFLSFDFLSSLIDLPLVSKSII